MPIARSRLEILQIRKLLKCVYDKDYDQILKLIDNGVQNLINYTEPEEGKTCLIVAATENDDETIRYLLDNGAHPDVVDLEGRTPAMKAAQYGHVDSFRLLLDANCDLNKYDIKGKSVLYYCIDSTERHKQCMELALECPVDVNSLALDGRTVLSVACDTAHDNEEICLMLLEHGADPSIASPKSGLNALMAACSSNSSVIVSRCLRKGVDPNAIDNFKKTAAHYAAKSGNFKALVSLAAFGAVFDVYDNTESNPLHYAAKVSGICCKYLGQRGCNPKVKNVRGDLPKVIAKGAKAKDAMKELRKVERSFGKVGKNNEPYALALYDWTVERSEEINRDLINLDPEKTGVVNKKEFLDLMKALKAPITEEVETKILPQFDKKKDGNFDYVDFLTGKKYVNKFYLMSAFEGKKKKKKKGGKGKKRKAKVPFPIPVMPEKDIMRPIDGSPPVMFIPKELHSTDLTRYSNGVHPSSILEDDVVWYMGEPSKQYINMNDAAKHGDIDSIKKALSIGYNIDTRDRYYKTPLMSAAMYGNLDVCMSLLKYGADVNATDNLKWTALHHAAHCGMIDVIELLLNNGANIDARALNGSTALHRAIETSRINIVQFLLKHGARLNIENKKGLTPMDTAYTWADPRVIDIVKAKFDLLPPAKDKKKSGSRSASNKRKTKSTGDKQLAQPEKPDLIAIDRAQSELTLQRALVTLTRQAHRPATTSGPEEDITYIPSKLPGLVPAPLKQTLLRIKQERRERFGWEIDFPDEFRSHFQQNIAIKVGPEEAIA